MRFDFSGPADGSMIEELLFLVMNMKKVRNTPYMKAGTMSTPYFIFFGVSLALFAVMMVMYLYFKTVLYLIVAVFLGLLAIMCLAYVIMVKSKINKFRQGSGDRSIEFTEEYVEATNKTNTVRFEWGKVLYVIINKYTVLILPKEEGKNFISTPSVNKDAIIKFITDIGRKDLIIDNTAKK